MKKMFLVAAATIAATVSFSQVRFGVQAIGNAGNVSVKYEDAGNLKKSARIGFGAGVVAEIPLQNNFSLRPSLNFLQKKAEIEFPADEESGKTSTMTSSLNYLELPVNLVYSIPVNNMSVYFSAGPSLGYGISGKMKYKGWQVSEEPHEVTPVEESTDAFKKEDKGGAGLKRFDLSANVNAGIQLNNGLYVNAGYLAGLSNLVESEGKYKNRGILLTVGFLLPSRK